MVNRMAEQNKKQPWSFYCIEIFLYGVGAVFCGLSMVWVDRNVKNPGIAHWLPVYSIKYIAWAVVAIGIFFIVFGVFKAVRIQKLSYKKIFFWFGINFIIFFTIFYLFAPEPLGILEAKFDLWRGHYEIWVYGYPSFLEPLFAQSLKKYNIEYKRVALCGDDRIVMDYVKGYNGVMEEEIARVFPEEVTRLIRAGVLAGI